MFTLAARRMGYRVIVFAPEDDTPAGQIAFREIRAPYEDLDAVCKFARQVDVVTFEFENVPAETAAAAARCSIVRPDGSLLHTTQHRRREKEALRAAGVPVARFATIDDRSQLDAAVAEVGTPAILKTVAWGYDGKGQARINDPAAAGAAFNALGEQPCVLEALVPFEREISLVGARGIDGSIALYDPVENHHVNHILDVSISPAGLPDGVADRARDIAATLLETWNVIGVICVEMFLLPDGDLVVNEVAPRPHNSGHLTIDAHVCSQFEQQVRAVCGLPLGSTRPLGPAAMVNLLGDLWSAGEPDWAGVVGDPEVKLHLYGKGAARPGRKMGHLTVLSSSTEEARRRALDARAASTGATGVR
jgi:5-(carboxyamino)imidazole ribonucleotide synthase